MNPRLLTLLFLLVGCGLAVCLGWPRDFALPVYDRMPASQAPYQPDASPASTSPAAEVEAVVDYVRETFVEP